MHFLNYDLCTNNESIILIINVDWFFFFLWITINVDFNNEGIDPRWFVMSSKANVKNKDGVNDMHLRANPGMNLWGYDKTQRKLGKKNVLFYALNSWM